MPDLDNDAGSALTDASTSEPADTQSTGASSEVTQGDALAADGTSADPGLASAGTPAAEDAQPSFTGDTEAQAVPESQKPAPNPFEKRYKDLQGWSDRVHQKNLELERRLQQLESELQKRAQVEQQPKTEPWDPDDPRHAEFLRLVDRADYYDELLRGEQNPDVIKSLQAKQLSVLGEENIALLQRWQQSVRAQERERRLNPAAFYRKLIRQEAQPVVRETLQSTSERYQMSMQAVNDVRDWMKNSEIATEENRQSVLNLMEKHGMPFEVAKTAVEREHYRKLVSAAKKATQSAEEKERLLQGNAAGVIARNPNASKKVNIQKLRQERGIKDGRAFADLLFELDNEGML